MSKTAKQTVIEMIAAPALDTIFKSSTANEVKLALDKFSSKHTGIVRYSISSQNPTKLAATVERLETDAERHRRMMAEAKIKLEAKRAELKARDAAKKAEKEKKAAKSLEKEYKLYQELKKKFENGFTPDVVKAKIDAKKAKSKTQKKSVPAAPSESAVSEA